MNSIKNILKYFQVTLPFQLKANLCFKIFIKNKKLLIREKKEFRIFKIKKEIYLRK